MAGMRGTGATTRVTQRRAVVGLADAERRLAQSLPAERRRRRDDLLRALEAARARRRRRARLG